MARDYLTAWTANCSAQVCTLISWQRNNQQGQATSPCVPALNLASNHPVLLIFSACNHPSQSYLFPFDPQRVCFAIAASRRLSPLTQATEVLSYVFDIQGTLSSDDLDTGVTQRSCFPAELGTLQRHHLFPQERKYYTYKPKCLQLERYFTLFPSA